MFKGILPAKRISSSDFTMVTSLADVPANGKENQPGGQPQLATVTKIARQATATKGFQQPYEKKKKTESKGNVQPSGTVGPETNLAFDRLLDDLQIPSTLRPKLAGMDSTVKAAMLKSSHVLALKPNLVDVELPTTPHSTTLRRTRSTESLGSPRLSSACLDDDVLQPPVLPFASPVRLSSHHASSVGVSPSPRKVSSHIRGLSYSGLASRSQINLPSSGSVIDLTTGGKTVKDKLSSIGKNMSPTKLISILTSTSSTELDVELIKKLRLLLRNESASWSQEFLSMGGYSALLTRLNEILEVEWREEQHDDQLLHELLRCFKALSTSSIGCFALRSSCPTPFVQLVALLYSDKKPGDVATRQLIVDLILILFELYPASALPAHSNGMPNRARREIWDNESEMSTSSNLITLPAPHKTFFSLIRALLLTPAPPPTESPATPVSPHAFIESLHKSRIYKSYLQELSDICRDYFWVFCHPNNTIWVLSETDEGRVEKPRAPGGMTGGVEFEAMGYFTTHLRLINALAQCAADLKMPKEHDLSAFRLHSDLFLSGLERMILISRKASTTYYPTLHLELARYIAHAGSAGYELPWAISRLLGPPPPALCKTKSVLSTSPPPSPTKCAGRGPPPGFLSARLDLNDI
ncbi:armadillo-type protein [Armillaria borealis]|uniref:Armadillo-type protein n=1 Tax=Armillaria borealis TaxID=47425 RepID=A0AA39MU32_9AGAR|nr:armadillo-type protein [Armillaria borealis]